MNASTEGKVSNEYLGEVRAAPKEAPEPRAPDRMETIPTEQLRECATNPRKVYDDIDGLAASIANVGVQQPLVVRESQGKTRYEIVFGHRRYRAAKKAGLLEVPCVVRQLTDVEVLKAQLAENIARKELHPLDEAEALAVLHGEYKVPAEEIAKEVGKTLSWVHQTLQLRKLCPEARKAFSDGKLNKWGAIEIARIPSQKLQAEVTKRALEVSGLSHERMSERELKALIREKYMRSLRDAAFSQKDDMLVPAAGACLTCPKRSGNMVDLFEEWKRADVCTDVGCFQDKLDAHWAAIRAKAKEEGKKSLGLEEGRKVFKRGTPSWDSDWVELDAPCPDDPKKRTWREVLGEEALEANVSEVRVAPDERAKPHEILRRDEALSIAKAEGVKWAARAVEQEAKREDKRPARSEEEAAEAEVQDAVEREVLNQAVAQVEKEDYSPFSLRMLCFSLITEPPAESTMERWELKNDRELEKFIREGATKPQLRALAFDLAVTRWAAGGHDGLSNEMKALSLAFKINTDALFKKMRPAVEAAKLFKKT